MFTSDHGEQMGDHWMKGKTGYFDQTFHVPLIVRDPRAEADAHRGSVNQSIGGFPAENLLENADGIRRQCSLGAAAGYLLFLPTCTLLMTSPHSEG